jgi:hypothetical protein
MTVFVYDVVHPVTQTQIRLMQGFSSTKQHTRSSSYWVASYTKDNEDEPLGIHKKVLSYKPGQDKETLMTNYCNSIMKINRNIWEILVHQGPSEVPDSGDQIVIRLSREPFKGCSQLQ